MRAVVEEKRRGRSSVGNGSKRKAPRKPIKTRKPSKTTGFGWFEIYVSLKQSFFLGSSSGCFFASDSAWRVPGLKAKGQRQHHTEVIGTNTIVRRAVFSRFLRLAFVCVSEEKNEKIRLSSIDFVWLLSLVSFFLNPKQHASF